MLNFHVIFSIISLRKSQVPKHMPTSLRSPSSAGQGPWQQQRAQPHRWWPWHMIHYYRALYWWEAQCCRKLSSGHPGRPPNSLATAVTPLSPCLRAEWQGAPEELCTAPQGWRALGEVWSKKSLQSDCKECKALLDSSGWMTNKWQQWSY